MIQFNVTYLINDGQESIIFNEEKGSTVSANYSEGVLKGTLEGNLLKATFQNRRANVSGLIEIFFSLNGFTAKWKQGIEPGPMKGKWIGKLDNLSNIILSVPEEIKETLKEQLIKPKVGIDAIYTWLFSYYKSQFGDFEALSDLKLYKDELSEQFKEIKQRNIRTIGIDFPIRLSKGKNRPVLMICAMDPLRAEPNETSNNGEIGFWVPFSVINSIDSKNNKSSDRSNLTFFHTLLETYDIYVTDIYKVFYREGQRKSNTQKEFKKNTIHKDILDNEIKIINPQAILTLGNDARDAICQILELNSPTWTDKVYSTTSKNNFNVIMVPHISGAANGTKAKIVNNLFYKSIHGENNVKYARIIINTLKNSN
jgi:hypothetical protein